MSLFVTFEGPDGAGKSTQVRLVADLLRKSGTHVVLTREPGGTPLGERIRSVLLDPGECAIVPRAEALLMSAARSQHVSEVIQPALEDGAIVLCDRFVDSTLAYQGAGRGLSVPALTKLQEFAVESLKPDLTILLDLPPSSGIQRRRESGIPLNRLDEDDLAFHQRVREWYVQEARQHPERWTVLDATRPEGELAVEIAELIRVRGRTGELNAGTNRVSG
ncbi:MAG: dTMP kinase [Thermomicrobiaceae bacterium]